MKCRGYIIFIISKNKKNVTEKIIIDLLDFQRKNWYNQKWCKQTINKKIKIDKIQKGLTILQGIINRLLKGFIKIIYNIIGNNKVT